MANGTYATTFDELAVDIPWTGQERWGNGGTDQRSNGEWSVQLWKVGNLIGVYAGRLTGKYKGIAFMWYFSSNATNFPIKQILCGERYTAGISYEGEKGSYCQKIWKGTLVEKDNVWMYSMP